MLGYYSVVEIGLQSKIYLVKNIKNSNFESKQIKAYSFKKTFSSTFE